MNGNDYEGKARCFDPPGVEKTHERLVAGPITDSRIRRRSSLNRSFDNRSRRLDWIEE